MNTSQNIALIPAYEPEETLLELIDALSEAGCNIVVVDDGSGPAYSVLFAQAREKAAVLTHKNNLGKGAALKTGLDYISRHCGPDSVIVTVDADGQHRAEDAMKISLTARCHPDTLVLGSRALAGDIPLRSRFGNTVTRFVYRLSTGLKVHDTQTGLRAFHRQLISVMLGISGDRYEYEMNVLLEFARRGIPIREEEIATIYIGGNSSSHFNTVRDSWKIYKEILRFSASSFAGFVVNYRRQHDRP